MNAKHGFPPRNLAIVGHDKSSPPLFARASRMIRIARAADAAVVTAIVNDAYSVYVARNNKTPGPMRDDYAALIGARRVNILEDGGEIIGLIVLIPEQDTMLLDNVAVHPRMQGRGFGVRLIAFAEQRARDAGFATIRLYTQDIMTENLALYRRLGFTETHRGEALGLNRIYLSKKL
jgi:ribosomal protein S18 acetylase RimI-like enzyme